MAAAGCNASRLTPYRIATVMIAAVPTAMAPDIATMRSQRNGGSTWLGGAMGCMTPDAKLMDGFDGFVVTIA